MKRVKFRECFWLAAFVIWLAAGRDAFSSILLMLASAYEIADVVPKLWKGCKNADRKS